MRYFSLFFSLMVMCLTASPSICGSHNRNKRPTMGHNQEDDYAALKNIFDGTGTYSYALTSLRYDSNYRPPTSNEDVEPTPTIVEIAIRSIKILDFNNSTKTLEFTADLVQEYTDLRLTFDNAQEKKFVRLPSLALYWKPSLDILRLPVGDGSKSSASIWTTSTTTTESRQNTFLTPAGRVFLKWSVKSQAERVASVSEGMEFEVKISEWKDTVEDVQYEWNKSNPITFETNFTEDKGGNKYVVKPKMDKCKKIINMGKLGDLEYSCIKLTFKLAKQ